jgi:hypothetical protein
VLEPPQHSFDWRRPFQNPLASDLAQTQTLDCLADPLFGSNWTPYQFNPNRLGHIPLHQL